ncbi:MAG: hypothetical protein WC834_08305, partial [Eubacteriales bacterium]
MNTDLEGINPDKGAENPGVTINNLYTTKNRLQVIQVYFSTQPSSAVSDKTAETAEDAESAETKKSLVKLFKGSYFI